MKNVEEFSDNFLFKESGKWTISVTLFITSTKITREEEQEDLVQKQGRR